jgi:hypothetical protein
MNIEDAASAFLILLPIAFNAFFFLLARLFDYPDILRSPTEVILSRFQAGGVRLKLLWFGFMVTAILLAPLAVLLGQVLARDGLTVVPTATVVGVLAAVMQFLGLARWPFLVPALARTYHDPASSQATREATVVVFESFHRYSASQSASASAISSPERGLCSSAWRCSSHPRSRRGSPGPGSRSASSSSSARSSSSAASRRRAGNLLARSSRSPTSPGRFG